MCQHRCFLGHSPEKWGLGVIKASGSNSKVAVPVLASGGFLDGEAWLSSTSGCRRNPDTYQFRNRPEQADQGPFPVLHWRLTAADFCPCHALLGHSSPSSPCLTNHHLPWFFSSLPFKWFCQYKPSDNKSMRITPSCGFVILPMIWVSLVGSKNAPVNHSQTRTNHVVAMSHICKNKHMYLSMVIPHLDFQNAYSPGYIALMEEMSAWLLSGFEQLLQSYTTLAILMSSWAHCWVLQDQFPFIYLFSIWELHSQTEKQHTYLSQSTKLGFLCL